jgi:hypothetical protein
MQNVPDPKAVLENRQRFSSFSSTDIFIRWRMKISVLP